MHTVPRPPSHPTFPEWAALLRSPPSIAETDKVVLKSKGKGGIVKDKAPEQRLFLGAPLAPSQVSEPDSTKGTKLHGKKLSNLGIDELRKKSMNPNGARFLIDFIPLAYLESLFAQSFLSHPAIQHRSSSEYFEAFEKYHRDPRPENYPIKVKDVWGIRASKDFGLFYKLDAPETENLDI